jgi:hypothetical protein
MAQNRTGLAQFATRVPGVAAKAGWNEERRSDARKFVRHPSRDESHLNEIPG